MTNHCDQYPLAIYNMTEKFIERWFQELYQEEPEYRDRDVMWNSEVGFWPVEIHWETYLDVDHIYIAEKHNIPCKTVQQRHDDKLDAHYDNEKGINTVVPNLYNYHRMQVCPPEQLRKEREEDLEKCRNSVEFARNELEKAITNHKGKWVKK